MRTLDGHLYDYPKYYDLVYGSDWRAERDFLDRCFQRFADGAVRDLFEPACGTGRLMYRLAKAGYRTWGNDLNRHAVDYCNKRLARHGFPETAIVGDMSAFTLTDFSQQGCPRAEPFDAAFNTINSVRHLPSEEAIENHLRCVADAVRPGGLYCLGLHLTPTDGPRIEEESWSASRGNLTVVSSLWSEEIDLEARRESIGMRFDVFTLTEEFSIRDHCIYRTYTAAQMQSLLDRVPMWEPIETFDFTYNLSDPITIDETTEDVVYILKRTD